MTHARPQAQVTYYAPIALASLWPLIYGEHHGVIVDGPSQSQGVVYGTREAAEAALTNPAIWNPKNAQNARVAALTYQGDIKPSQSGFAFATADEMTDHEIAVIRAAAVTRASRA